MIYVTGETRRSFSGVKAFCQEHNTTKDDVLIILGNACINYYGGIRDYWLKQMLAELPITLLCVRGNLEERATNLTTYKPVKFYGGYAMAEKEFPSLCFAADGSVYNFGDQAFMVIGGCAPADGEERTANGQPYWTDTSPSKGTREFIEHMLELRKHQIDGFLTYTCPARYMAEEAEQENTDCIAANLETEQWFDTIDKQNNYNPNPQMSLRMDLLSFS